MIKLIYFAYANAWYYNSAVSAVIAFHQFVCLFLLLLLFEIKIADTHCCHS